MEIPMMQCVVASVSRGLEEQDRINLIQLLGTGFFINEGGIFLTARHVIEDGIASAEKWGGKLFFSPFHAELNRYVSVPIDQYEYAPDNFDVGNR